MSQVPPFDPDGACLVLAPHLEYPVRNGADITVDRMWPAFSNFVSAVVIVGKNTIRRYVAGVCVDESSYRNPHIPRSTAGLRSLINRSRYLLEKNLTPEFRATARKYLAKPEYKTVVASFVSTTPVLQASRDDERLLCVETHNDELQVYRQLAAASRNPLRKMVASVSVDWLSRFLSSDAARKFLFLHVSEADRLGYLRVAPTHKSLIMPIGVDDHRDDMDQYPAHTIIGQIHLLFVGSLSGQQNFDALRWFGTRFYPVLKNNLVEGLVVDIAGSNPTRRVTTLCQSLGWRLHSNVSDQELMNLYRASTFSLLPFPYTAGVKLKLLETLAAGIPCLAGEVLAHEIGSLPFPCLISNSPLEWVDHVQLVRASGISREQRVALAEFTRHRYLASRCGNAISVSLGMEPEQRLKRSCDARLPQSAFGE
jgi:glycosyltransferase involved in cell wall biosynthesis